jgi:arginyl-tRNA synthetase
LAKSYNRFWYHCSILKENDAETRLFRLQLSQLVATSLQWAMDLLGIEMPERM